MRYVLLALPILFGATLMTATLEAADEPLQGTFALFEMRESWSARTADEKRRAVEEAKRVVEDFRDRAAMDVYWTYGLTSGSHFLVRSHAAEAKTNQEALTALSGSALGRDLRLTFSLTGVTKALNYAPEFPALLKELRTAEYQGPPPSYVIVIPTRKDSAWWNLPKEERNAMMREHIEPTLPYLSTVKRKLYHAAGLGDADFITYFETADLAGFNDLVVALRKVREDGHTVRLGEPTVLGTIKSWDDVLRTLETL